MSVATFKKALLLVVLLTACPMLGQAVKKRVTPADYALWGSLTNISLSEGGSFSCYSIAYKNVTDTLFVKKVSGGRTYAFANARNGNFIGESHFVCIAHDSLLVLQDLQKGIRKTFSGTSDYQIGNQNTLLVFGRDHGKGSTLEIRSTNGTLLKTLRGISSWNYNSVAAALLYCKDEGESQVGIIHLDAIFSESVLVHDDSLSFVNPVWNEEGKAVAFISRTKGMPNGVGERLYYGSSDGKKLCSLDPKKQPGWPKGHALNSFLRDNLYIAKDGERVFFYTRDTTLDSTVGVVPKVRIWNTADKFLQAHTERYGPYQHWPRLSMWVPATGMMRSLGTDDEPMAQLNGSESHAITSSPVGYTPTTKQSPDRDCYITNLATGEKELLLSGLPQGSDFLNTSPDGRYIIYFKNRAWWVYSIADKTHRNLTKNNNTDFTDAAESRPGYVVPYPCAGWTPQGQVLLYDTHDLWAIGLTDTKAIRLTDGKERNRVYRIDRSAYCDVPHFSAGSLYVDISKPLLLEARDADYSTSGYFRLYHNRLEEIIYGAFRAGALVKASDCETYTYTTETYDRPPAIGIKKRGKRNTTLVQSNRQQQHFLWGRSELVHYSNRYGEALKGVLYYPAGYDPSKQYPMVVHLYERQLFLQHAYTNPSLYNAAGFNKSNFTTNGYFVLYPDISYTVWEPGISALDCVTAAVDAALLKASIDKQRVGLIGHSFGGYETNYIISHSNRFRAAVSGNGASDPATSYLSVGWSYALPNFWRFEHNQYRMGYIFGNWDKYDANSAVRFADNVTTPLLGWMGEEDTQVNPYQSYEFYIALRRLGKKEVLLAYPGEGHVIIDPDKQQDLSIKIMEWFDHYLRDAPEPRWCVPK